MEGNAITFIFIYLTFFYVEYSEIKTNVDDLTLGGRRI